MAAADWRYEDELDGMVAFTCDTSTTVEEQARRWDAARINHAARSRFRCLIGVSRWRGDYHFISPISRHAGASIAQSEARTRKAIEACPRSIHFR